MKKKLSIIIVVLLLLGRVLKLPTCVQSANLVK